ncbi:hypothetical protein [Marinoscillum sp.]|uniref:hypothetical protein n=1 Tax=Marinoscillum sp. TaxID=2024838 RepID=UPI003BAAE737
MTCLLAHLSLVYISAGQIGLVITPNQASLVFEFLLTAGYKYEGLKFPLLHPLKYHQLDGISPNFTER